MPSLCVLITNLAVAHCSGTETYVRDLASGLTRMGHRPIVYSTVLGELAEEIAASGTAVVDDLACLRRPPDVKARCAQEALAVGTAVVLCDANGVGELVGTDNWERLRRVNFGRRALSRPVSPETLAQEVSRYDAAEAGEVARRFRAVADLDRVLLDLVALYREAIDEQARLPRPDPGEEGRAAAAYLRHVSPKRLLDAWHLRVQQVEAEQRHWQEAAAELERELTRARAEADTLRRRPGRASFLSRVRSRSGLFRPEEG